LTQGDVLPGGTPVIDFSALPKVTKDGVDLYPINSEFGYLVTDFLGAVAKDFVLNPEYLEGWVGDLTGDGGEQIGLVVSDAPTDTFQTPALLGTWLAGLGGNTVKASTEHYMVMQHILSDQAYPGDPNAQYQLDDDLYLIGGDYDGMLVADVIPLVGDVNGDGVMDIKDVLQPNESTVTENIAVSTDYSVTLKDDGKLLYRWGNTIKKPNDVRVEAELDLPDEWTQDDASNPGLTALYRITSAELVTNHTVTNNPNDQIRPEDFENESAIGQLPTYEVVADYNADNQGPREVWVTTDAYYAGDGTLYPAGTVLKDALLAANWAASDLAGLGANDGAEGFTNAWYTTMDREPFEADLNDDGTEYDIGPRWRLQPDKYGQDLPGVVIPVDPSLPPPPTNDQVKYEVGSDTTTVINLLDWGLPISPLSISAGWQDEAGSVSINGLNLTDNFDIAFYIKGDIKPATIYNTTLVMDYEEITIRDKGDVIIGAAADDYLVGQGDNTFTGADGEDFFVLSYGVGHNWSDIESSVITDFEVGTDTLGLIGLGVTDVNFGTVFSQEVVGGDLVISLGDVELATLEGVTETIGLSDFVLIKPNGAPIDRLVGTTGDDYLVGDSFANRILGLEGNDTILGLGADDTLMGGVDNDLLLGGLDNDVLMGGTQEDTLRGDDGNDLLLGEGGFDQLFGDAGNDRLDGGAQADRLDGGTGDDVLFGSQGADILFGSAQNDRLFGGTEDDRLDGGTENDTLSGGSGFDVITGGSGDDNMTGNFNADQFVFQDGFGTDVITDFDALNNYERIDLSGVAAITDLVDLTTNGHLSQVGADAVIDDLLGNTITLLNVNVADLGQFDFTF
jgi:Ca2+-binding RTX toxin-like protein